MLALVAEIFTRRAANVIGTCAKRLGMTFTQFMDTSPKKAQEGLKVVSVLHHRYLSGDFRHDEREILRVEEFANWLIELGQNASGNPVRPIKMDTAKLETKRRCKPNTYRLCMQKVQGEW